MKRTLGIIGLFIASASAVVLILDRVAEPSAAPVSVTVKFPHEVVFPWEGETTLFDQAGQRLTWKVEHLETEVHLIGIHPQWRVEHHAKADGTPLSTVKQAGRSTTRVTWLAEGARVDRTDSHGKTSSITIHEPGLWDESTVVARLAGVSWRPGEQVRLRLVDLTLADGTVYPMVAEYVREERCGNLRCHHVHLALDDFRRLVSPTFELRYSTAPGAKFLQYDGEGFTFSATGQ